MNKRITILLKQMFEAAEHEMPVLHKASLRSLYATDVSFLMKYYFKVWLFTILVSPLFVIAGLVYQKSGTLSDFFEGLPIWFFAILFGSAFALPALFLFRLLNKDLAKHEIAAYWK